MKRYIKSMGSVNKAQLKPEHISYNPTVDLDSFKRLVQYAKSNNDALLIECLGRVIDSDIAADIEEFPNNEEEIKNYYYKYIKLI